MTKRISVTLAFLLLAAFDIAALPSVRIKEIASIRGARTNQLLGIGIVTGLAGRGDSPNLNLTKSSVANLLSHFGIEVSMQDIKSKNCAIVTVSAQVQPFVRPGDRIDVTVASIQDARSLEGGVLLQTALQAGNGQSYAAAQGRIVIPASNEDVKTVGRIPSGAIVEREILSEYLTGALVQIVLRSPDFATSAAVAKAIADQFAGIRVTSRDAALIEVTIPQERTQDPVSFIAELEGISVTPDLPGKVVIDSSSGVIIMGDKVKIGKVAVSYKRMSVTIGRNASGDKPDSFVINDTTTVEDFVATLKDVGLDTEAIIGILQALEKAGALFGELIIM